MALAAEMRKLTAPGMGEEPLAQFQSEAFSNLLKIESSADLAKAMNERHAANARDANKLNTALWLGAAWRFAEVRFLFSPDDAQQFAVHLNYSVVHARVCARLFR